VIVANCCGSAVCVRPRIAEAATAGCLPARPVPANLVCEAPDPTPYHVSNSVPGTDVSNSVLGTRTRGFDWSTCAVLARTRAALQPIRALCEHFRIPVVWGLDTQRPPRLHRVREIARLLDWLQTRRHEVCCASQFPWPESIEQSLAATAGRSAGAMARRDGGCPVAVADAIEFFYEALAEQRLEARIGRGVFLATAHAAKGMEFDHVLVAGSGWTRGGTPGAQEEERRLFYVAMTRARQTLTLTRRRTAAPACRPDPRRRGAGADRCWRQRNPRWIAEPLLRNAGLADLDLGFAGSHFHRHPIHAALEQLEPGSPLQLQPRGSQIVLTDSLGRVVARLSQAACATWRDRLDAVLEARVLAMLQRHRTDGQPEYRDRSRCDRWEIPLVEVVATTE
jgi:ATP-dependent DNA helicase RecQ